MKPARIDTPLRQALRARGIRQDWLASKVGANPDQMSKWVNGVHVPVEATRVRIAEALGESTDVLFPDESPPLGMVA